MGLDCTAQTLCENVAGYITKWYSKAPDLVSFKEGRDRLLHTDPSDMTSTIVFAHMDAETPPQHQAFWVQDDGNEGGGYKVLPITGGMWTVFDGELEVKINQFRRPGTPISGSLILESLI